MANFIYFYSSKAYDPFSKKKIIREILEKYINIPGLSNFNDLKWLVIFQCFQKYILKINKWLLMYKIKTKIELLKVKIKKENSLFLKFLIFAGQID